MNTFIEYVCGSVFESSVDDTSLLMINAKENVFNPLPKRFPVGAQINVLNDEPPLYARLEQQASGKMRIYHCSNNQDLAERTAKEITHTATRNLILLPDWSQLSRFGNTIVNPLSDLVARLQTTALPNIHLAVLAPAGYLLSVNVGESRSGLIQGLGIHMLIFGFDIPTDADISQAERPNMVLLAGGGANEEVVTRFLRLQPVPGLQVADEDGQDTRRLKKQRGGQTRNGYVVREPVEWGQPTTFDTYHPDTMRHRREVALYGKTTLLEDLFDVVISSGLRLRQEMKKGEHSHGDVPLLEPRHIAPDGELDRVDFRNWLPASVQRGRLNAGDVVVRQMVRPGTPRLAVARISPKDLPLAASDRVFVLRPKDVEVDGDLLDFYLSYLRSDLAAVLVRSLGAGFMLSASTLRRLPVPVPEEPIRQAFRELRLSGQVFARWMDDTRAAMNQLFTFNDSGQGPETLFSISRALVSRRQAGELVDRPEHRIRSQFPYPIAYLWRSVEAAQPNADGMARILECYEGLLCYAAQIAILLARESQITIGALDQLATKLTTQGHGTSLGEWKQILLEASDKAALRERPPSQAFYELPRVLMDSDVRRWMDVLSKARNDQAHGRRPRDHELPAQFNDARSTLLALLTRLSFLGDYRLRIVEETRVDSILQTTTYTYRDLQGDHPLAPLLTETTRESGLEAGSLYLVDHAGTLHLCRPLLTRVACSRCGQTMICHLDSYDSRAQKISLKGLEHGHGAHVEDGSALIPAFKAVGLIKNP